MNILFICDYLEVNATNICVWMVARDAAAKGHHCAICSYQGCVYDSCYDKSVNLGSQQINNTDYSFFDRFKDYILSYRPLSAIKRSRKCKLLRNVIDIKIKSFNPDVIVASLQPLESVIIGREIKKNMEDLFYVPYVLDAIYACKPLTGMPKWLFRILALYRERILFKEADSIVMMRSAKYLYSKSFFKPSYFSKITFFDVPFYRPVIPKQLAERKFFPMSQKVLFYAGTMPRSIRDPRFFMKVFSQIKDDTTHVYFAGKSDYMDEINEFSRIDKRFHFLGLLPHDEVIDRVCEADILLNFGNHFKGMMPSKIFEYISARKPIISTFFVDDDDCKEYLIKYNSALMLDERKDVSNAAKLMRQFIANPPLAPEYDKLDLLYHDNNPMAFVDFIEEKCRNF